MAIFTEARLKIERANKHISDLKARIVGLPDSCISTIEINPNGGNEVIKYELSDATAASDIALMIGDAAHNLRSALDYAWLKVLEQVAPTIIDRSTKFPVRESVEGLEATLKGRKIDILSSRLYDLVVSEIKPYNGGDIAIWPIHCINNADKHRLLTPLIQYGGVTGIEVNDDTGELRTRGWTWATTQAFPYYVAMPCGWHVKNKGKIFLSIMFDRTTFGNEFRSSDSLAFYSLDILQVVKIFEEF